MQRIALCTADDINTITTLVPSLCSSTTETISYAINTHLTYILPDKKELEIQLTSYTQIKTELKNHNLIHQTYFDLIEECNKIKPNPEYFFNSDFNFKMVITFGKEIFEKVFEFYTVNKLKGNIIDLSGINVNFDMVNEILEWGNEDGWFYFEVERFAESYAYEPLFIAFD